MQPREKMSWVPCLLEFPVSDLLALIPLFGQPLSCDATEFEVAEQTARAWGTAPDARPPAFRIRVRKNATLRAGDLRRAHRGDTHRLSLGSRPRSRSRNLGRFRQRSRGSWIAATLASGAANVPVGCGLKISILAKCSARSFGVSGGRVIVEDWSLPCQVWIRSKLIGNPASAPKSASGLSLDAAETVAARVPVDVDLGGRPRIGRSGRLGDQRGALEDVDPAVVGAGGGVVDRGCAALDPGGQIVHLRQRAVPLLINALEQDDAAGHDRGREAGPIDLDPLGRRWSAR